MLNTDLLILQLQRSALPIIVYHGAMITFKKQSKVLRDVEINGTKFKMR